jgi:hypothetical protein
MDFALRNRDQCAMIFKNKTIRNDPYTPGDDIKKQPITGLVLLLLLLMPGLTYFCGGAWDQKKLLFTPPLKRPRKWSGGWFIKWTLNPHIG